MAAFHWPIISFDDECRAHHWCRETFGRSKHEEINSQQTATKSGAPSLLMPERKGRHDLAPHGVLLIHGFLASPAEMAETANKIKELGIPVMSVRLKGHGTSPWDLKDRSWQDWLSSVRRGFEIMSLLADKVSIIGFSTGGALALRFAADQPSNLERVIAWQHR